LACFPAAEMKKGASSAFSYNRKKKASKGGYAGQTLWRGAINHRVPCQWFKIMFASPDDEDHSPLWHVFRQTDLRLHTIGLLSWEMFSLNLKHPCRQKNGLGISLQPVLRKYAGKIVIDEKG
jgi:hypothetical protein